MSNTTTEFDPSGFGETSFQAWAPDDTACTGPRLLAVIPREAPYPKVTEFLRKHSQASACVITAWNPGYKETDDYNAEANARLLADLQASGFTIYPAKGVATASDWSEDSFLVVGGDEALYAQWQIDYAQAAYVLLTADGRVQIRH